MFIRIGGKRVYMPGFCFDTDGDSGGGGDAGSGGNNDPTAAAQRMIDKMNGDALRVVENLLGENRSYREKNRTLNQQIADLTGKVPAEGAVVLAGDDAAAWAAYRELGDLEALKTQLADRERLAGELDGLRRNELLRSVAEAAGYKASVLQQIAGDLNYAVEEVERSGKKVPAAFVLEGEEGATKTPIADYMNKHYGEFLPVLHAKSVQPAYGNGRGPVPAGVGNHERDQNAAQERRGAAQNAF